MSKTDKPDLSGRSLRVALSEKAYKQAREIHARTLKTIKSIVAEAMDLYYREWKK